MHFYGLNLGPHGTGPSWTLGPSLEQNWLWTTRQCYMGQSWTLGPSFEQTWYRQCYIANYKHQSQVVLKKNFLIFFYVFLGLNLGSHGAGPSWTLGPSLEYTWYKTTRQWYISNLKDLRQAVLEKKIFNYITF